MDMRCTFHKPIERAANHQIRSRDTTPKQGLHIQSAVSSVSVDVKFDFLWSFALYGSTKMHPEGLL